MVVCFTKFRVMVNRQKINYGSLWILRLFMFSFYYVDLSKRNFHFKTSYPSAIIYMYLVPLFFWLLTVEVSELKQIQFQQNRKSRTNGWEYSNRTKQVKCRRKNLFSNPISCQCPSVCLCSYLLGQNRLWLFF